jgi:hypothetical protein
MKYQKVSTRQKLIKERQILAGPLTLMPAIDDRETSIGSRIKRFTHADGK